MAEVQDNLLYTESHEWVKKEGDSLLVGITDFAQHSLGDIVFVEGRSEGTSLQKGDSLGTIESVKAAEDVYSPVGGVISETNPSLADTPEMVNQTPYDAWLVRIKDYQESDLEALMDAAAYREYLKTQES